MAYVTSTITIQIPSASPVPFPAACAPLGKIYIAKNVKPISTVNRAPQRNQKRARGINSGTTLPLVGASSAFMNLTLTTLQEERRPIHVIAGTVAPQGNGV